VKDVAEPLKVDSAKILLATGSSAVIADKYRRYKRVFDSDTINGLSFLPRSTPSTATLPAMSSPFTLHTARLHIRTGYCHRSIVIQGGGIIALEFAKIFLRLDCKVTVLIRGDAAKSLVAKGLDPTIAALLIRDLEDSGITVMTDTLLDDVEVLFSHCASKFID
jgi:pyruvate/2-oxoglutarate dehydrogenase complex dihydrolipoamide dehydrogenase (E3) component